MSEHEVSSDDRQASSANTANPETGDLVLRFSSTHHSGQMVRLAGRKCTIGSAPGCSLCLRTSMVDSVHCLIVRGTNQTLVRNLANDARVNGRPFDQVPLQAGDRLALGPVEFEVVDLSMPFDVDLPYDSPNPPITDSSVDHDNGSAREGSQIAETVDDLRRSKQFVQARTQRLVADLQDAQDKIISQEDQLREQQTQLEYYRHQTVEFEERLNYLEGLLTQQVESGGNASDSITPPPVDSADHSNGENDRRSNETDTAPWPIQPESIRQPEQTKEKPAFDQTFSSFADLAASRAESDEFATRDTQPLSKTVVNEDVFGSPDSVDDEPVSTDTTQIIESKSSETDETNTAGAPFLFDDCAISSPCDANVVNAEGENQCDASLSEAETTCSESDSESNSELTDGDLDLLGNIDAAFSATDIPSVDSEDRPIEFEASDAEPALDDSSNENTDETSDRQNESLVSDAANDVSSSENHEDTSDGSTIPFPAPEESDAAIANRDDAEAIDIASQVEPAPHVWQEPDCFDHQPTHEEAEDGNGSTQVFENGVNRFSETESHDESTIVDQEAATEPESLADDLQDLLNQVCDGNGSTSADVESSPIDQHDAPVAVEDPSTEGVSDGEPHGEHEPSIVPVAPAVDDETFDSPHASESPVAIDFANDSPFADLDAKLGTEIQRDETSNDVPDPVQPFPAQDDEPPVAQVDGPSDGLQEHDAEPDSVTTPTPQMTEILGESEETVSDVESAEEPEPFETPSDDAVMEADTTSEEPQAAVDGVATDLRATIIEAVAVEEVGDAMDEPETIDVHDDGPENDAPENEAPENESHDSEQEESEPSPFAGLDEFTDLDESSVTSEDSKESFVPPALNYVEEDDSVTFEESGESDMTVDAAPQDDDADEESFVAMRESAESQGSGDDEESIEDYMAKLLQRVRGDGDDPADPSAAASTTPPPKIPLPAKAKKGSKKQSATNDVNLVEKAFANEVTERKKEFSPVTMPRRPDAAEIRVDLDAMREVANSSARGAIRESQQKREMNQIYLQLVGAVGAVLVGAALIGVSESLASMTFFAAFGFWGIGGYLGYRCFAWYRASITKLGDELTPGGPVLTELELDPGLIAEGSSGMPVAPQPIADATAETPGADPEAPSATEPTINPTVDVLGESVPESHESSGSHSILASIKKQWNKFANRSTSDAAPKSLDLPASPQSPASDNQFPQSPASGTDHEA